MSIKIIETEVPPKLVRLDQYGQFILDSSLAENFIVRAVVANKLEQAQKLLPNNYKLIIGEVYRTHAKQKRMWHEVYDKIKSQYPDVSTEECTRKTEVWIANPYTHGSGHQTGAAVDAALAKLCVTTGQYQEVDMGTRMQEFNEKTVTNCPFLTTEQDKHRKLLLECMSAVGLVNYPDEWWHFSYGDRLWASLSNQAVTLFAALNDAEISRYITDRRS